MRTLLRLRRLLSVALLLCVSSLSWAWNYFEKDGIYYNINSDQKSVTVTYASGNGKYSGEVVIPSIAINDYEMEKYGGKQKAYIASP